MTRRARSIYVRISHGLGNQLFQYATGLAAAARTGAQLVIDRHFSSQDDPIPHNVYMLDQFPISAIVGEERDLPPVRRHRLRYRLWKIRSAFTGQRIVEHRNSFTLAALKPPSGAQLLGYWQNEDYFSDKAELVRQELSPYAPEAVDYRETLEHLQVQPITASIHIRRGDYITATQSFVNLKPDYYRSAMRRLESDLQTDSITYFVFSDDPDWVKANLELPESAVIVGHRVNATATGDLWLMSKCDHHIIANSTFSWWGAWLNPSQSKTVITPERWYTNPELSNDFINPKNWVRHSTDRA